MAKSNQNDLGALATPRDSCVGALQVDLLEERSWAVEVVVLPACTDRATAGSTIEPSAGTSSTGAM